jgi:hypothetical protein
MLFVNLTFISPICPLPFKNKETITVFVIAQACLTNLLEEEIIKTLIVWGKEDIASLSGCQGEMTGAL